MACECNQVSAKTETERATLRIALQLNAMMFVVGMAAGLWAQSTGLIADALDMLADASAYAIALMAISRSATFKRYAARWSGIILLILGIGIILDVVRRGLIGSDPQGQTMMIFSAISLAVNTTVLKMLAKFRHGEVHLRATWIFTRADVLANIGVFLSGMIVWLTSFYIADLMVGLAIGLYVINEAAEIFKESFVSNELSSS